MTLVRGEQLACSLDASVAGLNGLLGKRDVPTNEDIHVPESGFRTLLGSLLERRHRSLLVEVKRRQVNLTLAMLRRCCAGCQVFDLFDLPASSVATS